MSSLRSGPRRLLLFVTTCAPAVTIFPLVVFCTAANQIITGSHRSDVILLVLLSYDLAVLLAIIAHRRGRRRPLPN